VRTNQFAAIMSVTISIWALALSYFGDESLNSNTAFFMAITGVSVVVCLLHLRSAAFTVALAISVPFVVRFGLEASPSFIAMAINMLFVTATLLVVVAVQSGHFANAIDARTKLELANRENFRLANRDSLTGLNNRRRFFSRLKEVFDKSKAQGRCIAVGIIDLDGFKPVNDLYGHVVGDALLLEVGQRLTEVADENIHVSRLGGDEFALIFVDCWDSEKLLQKGEELCAALRRAGCAGRCDDPSFGVDGAGRISGTGQRRELQLYERADYALYNGKRSRRGHATLFTDEHVMQIAQSTRLEQVLRDADLEEGNRRSTFSRSSTARPARPSPSRRLPAGPARCWATCRPGCSFRSRSVRGSSAG
jgi:diguanylate cyclase (GGDEF)-like protein